MKIPRPHFVIGAASLALAGASGFAAAVAVGGPAQAARTVTVNVGTGATGPPGPQGPPGPPGTTACPTGFSPGDLVINHPGGQVTLFTCLKD